jgi:hypothetical protein
VSRSGFYASVPRHTATCLGAEEAALGARVKAMAAETRASDGGRRLAQPLQDDGLAVGRDQAHR